MTGRGVVNANLEINPEGTFALERNEREKTCMLVTAHLLDISKVALSGVVAAEEVRSSQ